jgi:hypothetical protein
LNPTNLRGTTITPFKPVYPIPGKESLNETKIPKAVIEALNRRAVSDLQAIVDAQIRGIPASRARVQPKPHNRRGEIPTYFGEGFGAQRNSVDQRHSG